MFLDDNSYICPLFFVRFEQFETLYFLYKAFFSEEMTKNA